MQPLSRPLPLTSSLSLFLVVLASFLLTADASWYIAEGAKLYYKGKDTLTVQTIKITSVTRALPFHYYEFFGDDLPFCRPNGEVKGKVDGGCNIGQCLSGDYYQNTEYKFNVTLDVPCVSLATQTGCKGTVTAKDISNFKELIDWEYRAQLKLDNLPVALNNTNEGRTHYDIGYPVGGSDATGYFLYNHLAFKIEYANATSANDSVYILGFIVKQMSIDFTNHICDANHNIYDFTHNKLYINENTTSVPWTYSVEWIQDNTNYNERWDKYFEEDKSLHTVSATYAVIVAVALTVFLGVILVRIIRTNPLAKFNFDDVEESGWKTLHGDVFRPPRHFMILSVLVGGGAQLLATAFFICLLGFVGVLSAARSGSMNMAIVVVYPMMGFVAGYTSARVYTRLGGARKRRNAVFTAVGFNGLIFIIYFIAEIILWANHSSAGKPGTFFSVWALWLFVHCPLVFLGAFFAHKRPTGQDPTGTNTIPRMIPPAPWYSHTYLLTPLLAVLPFGVAFNEIFDLMDSMWSHQLYNNNVYVLGVFILLTIIVAEVSVVLCYFQLANENYHWWWRAFYIPATVMLYIFLTAMFYVGMDIEMKVAGSVFLYLSYTAIMLLVVFVFMSSISFYACWTFVHKIYTTLHVD